MSMMIAKNPKMRRIMVTVPQILDDQNRDVTMRELKKVIVFEHFGGERATLKSIPSNKIITTY
jgi:hypothetical protein